MFDIRNFEKFLHRKDPTIISRLLLGVLYVASLGFKFVVILRNFLYDAGIIKIKSASVPVISIGNITVGGSGKTPFVLFLVRDLLEKRKVAVLNSGYLSELESRLVTSCKMGDEAFLIHSYFKGRVPVISGRDRIQSAEYAAKLEAELLVIDDGMQYRKIQKDLEIVAVDGKDPLGGGYFLPRGFLRDLSSRLRDVDLLVINDIEHKQEFFKIKKMLRTYTEVPIIGMKRSIKNKSLFEEGEKVALFCGIAKPQAFIELVEKELKICLVYRKILLDHEKLGEKDLSQFVLRAVGAGAKKIICTEKDFVHYKTKEREIPIIPIELELSISFGKDDYDDMLLKALSLKENWGKRL